MEYAEGCELINYNDIVETNHKAQMININAEDYLKEEFNVWDKINYIMLNLAK